MAENYADYCLHKDSFTPDAPLGAKARNLFIMQREGIAVPQFICITQKCFQDEAISSAFVEEVMAQFPKETTLFSVRSCSHAEDSTDASFAGQFDTYLQVKREDVFEKVLSCYRSLHAASVLKYAQSAGANHQLAMDVIVQEMKQAEGSGVVFTANPQGLLSEMVVVCGEGTGDHVVEDKVPTTTYYCDKLSSAHYFEMQEHSYTLSAEMLANITEVSNDIERLFARPVDIEFCIADEQLFILQARPITTLGQGERVILDSSNIVESYPGISLPLTASFVSSAYSKVFGGLVNRMVKAQRLQQAYGKDTDEMVACVNGRMYYKITSWYSLLAFLPFSKKIIPIWQDMLGVENKEVSVRAIQASVWQRAKINVSIVKNFLGVNKNMQKLHKDFLQTEQYFREAVATAKTNEELRVVYERLQEKILNQWDITLINDLYAFVFTGLLKRNLKKRGVPNHEYVANSYIAGILSIESMKPVLALIDLCKTVLDGDESLETIADSKAFAQYQKRYGDRVLEELKLESKTFRTHPELLVEEIATYCQNPDKLDLIAQVANEDDRPVNFYAKHACRGIENREMSRLDRARVYGMAREIFLRCGENLHKAGHIIEPRDVLYLSVEEIFLGEQDQNFKALVEKRKTEYSAYEQLPFYPRLVFAGEVYNKRHRNINAMQTVQSAASHLSGIPASVGTVTGEVVVIHDPSDAHDVAGKILVTQTTDPGWVFMLTLAKGVVSEKGSLLSHTAIISRELKIPSIVGVENATNMLQTGDIVTIDGATGTIEIIKKADVGVTDV